MKGLSNIDYIYSIAMIIVGIVMISSPRTFMGRAKYDEDSLKTEKFLKIMGIVIMLLSVVFAGFIFFR